MSTKRYLRLLVVALVVVLAVASLAVYGLTRSNAQIDEEQQIYDGFGIRYSAPPEGMRPAISEADAITKALKEAIPQVSVQPDTPIEARFVIYNDDVACELADPDAAHSECVTYLYQDIPAWIVTVRDIQFFGMAGSSKYANEHELEYNSEVHVAINAMTGEIITVYSFR